MKCKAILAKDIVRFGHDMFILLHGQTQVLLTEESEKCKLHKC
jgi:hypothetical protein